MFTEEAEKAYYFMIYFRAYLLGPKLTNSGHLKFIGYYIPVCLSAG